MDATLTVDKINNKWSSFFIGVFDMGGSRTRASLTDGRSVVTPLLLFLILNSLINFCNVCTLCESFTYKALSW